MAEPEQPPAAGHTSAGQTSAGPAAAGRLLKETLSLDHLELYDPQLAQSYFAKFARIGSYFTRIAAELAVEEQFSRAEIRLLGQYLQGVVKTFSALELKYMMTGRVDGAPRLTIDRHESGFPVAQELMVMALDAQQAEKHLAGMSSTAALKDRMLSVILGELKVPLQLQYALSQRLYFEALRQDGLFWARNDPDAQWLGEAGDRRRFLIHWAVWDTQVNLPVIYLLEVEDSGAKPLPQDAYRWPPMQQKLLAQSLGGLKLLTIARGFDADFQDLHPKRLRRITLGPMYSAGFTLQSGPISQVLADAKAPEDEDWALVWTLEDLVSEREESLREGWFSSRVQQVWRLDPHRGADIGASRMERMLVMPERPYQVLVDQDPPGLRGIRKFVVGAGGRLIPGA